MSKILCMIKKKENQAMEQCKQLVEMMIFAKDQIEEKRFFEMLGLVEKYLEYLDNGKVDPEEFLVQLRKLSLKSPNPPTDPQRLQS